MSFNNSTVCLTSRPEDKDREPAVLDMIGQDYGLGVVMSEIRDDFAYVRRPAYGMEVDKYNNKCINKCNYTLFLFFMFIHTFGVQ